MNGSLPEPDCAPEFRRQPLLFFWFLFACWVLSLAFSSIIDADIWFHLSAAKETLANLRPPITDTFSYTSYSQPYISIQWLFQLLLHAGFSLAGSYGLVLVKAGLIISFILLIYKAAGMKKTDGSLLLMLLAVSGCLMSLMLRPLLLSLSLQLLFLLVWRRDRQFWLFPVLQIIWVNSHGLFILGIFTVFCWALDSWRQRWRWLAATVAVSFLNPYGIRGFTFPFLLFTRIRGRNIYSENIQEFASTFRSGFFRGHVSGMSCLLLLGLSLACLVYALQTNKPGDNKRISPGSILLLCGFTFLYLLAQRNLPLFAVVAPWLVCRWQPAVPGFNVPRKALRMILFTCLALIIPLQRLAAAATGYPGSMKRLNRRFADLAAHSVPAAAADFLIRHQWQGRMFNDFNWGGYLMFRMWPRNQVFIDQRLEVHSLELFTEYIQMRAAPERFSMLQEKYGFDIAIFDHHPASALTGLFRKLYEDPAWVIAYADHMAVIFARKDSAANNGILRQPRASLPVPRPLTELRSEYIESGLKNYSLWSPPAGSFSYENQGWGNLALYQGEHQAACAFMLQAALRSPQLGANHFAVAVAALQAGDGELFIKACENTMLIQPGHPDLRELYRLGGRWTGE